MPSPLKQCVWRIGSKCIDIKGLVSSWKCLMGVITVDVLSY